MSSDPSHSEEGDSSPHVAAAGVEIGNKSNEGKDAVTSVSSSTDLENLGESDRLAVTEPERPQSLFAECQSLFAGFPWCSWRDLLPEQHTGKPSEIIGGSVYIFFLSGNLLATLFALMVTASQVGLLLYFREEQIELQNEIKANMEDTEGLSGIITVVAAFVVFYHTGGDMIKGIQLVIRGQLAVIFSGLTIFGLALATFIRGFDYARLTESEGATLIINAAALIFILGVDEATFEMAQHFAPSKVQRMLDSIDVRYPALVVEEEEKGEKMIFVLGLDEETNDKAEEFAPKKMKNLLNAIDKKYVVSTEENSKEEPNAEPGRTSDTGTEQENAAPRDRTQAEEDSGASHDQTDSRETLVTRLIWLAFVGSTIGTILGVFGTEFRCQFATKEEEVQMQPSSENATNITMEYNVGVYDYDRTPHSSDYDWTAEVETEADVSQSFQCVPYGVFTFYYADVREEIPTFSVWAQGLGLFNIILGVSIACRFFTHVAHFVTRPGLELREYFMTGLLLLVTTILATILLYLVLEQNDVCSTDHCISEFHPDLMKYPCFAHPCQLSTGSYLTLSAILLWLGSSILMLRASKSPQSTESNGNSCLMNFLRSHVLAFPGLPFVLIATILLVAALIAVGVGSSAPSEQVTVNRNRLFVMGSIDRLTPSDILLNRYKPLTPQYQSYLWLNEKHHHLSTQHQIMQKYVMGFLHFKLGLGTPPDENECEWEGMGTITCVGWKVTGLNFTGVYDGELPREIEGLSESLTSLSMVGDDDYRLSGTLPNFIGRLTALQELHLPNNALNSRIPNNFLQLSSLIKLDLSDNAISGQILENIGDLESLQEVNLGGCSLRGSIPWQIGTLSDVEKLNISSNQLSGTLPENVGMTSLRELDLSGNRISGSIPPSYALPNSYAKRRPMPLEVLDLSNNLLGGEIPTTFSELRDLELLDLSGNELTGPVWPYESHKLKSLKRLNLRDNALTGEIHVSIGDLKDLRVLNMAYNLISGSVPGTVKKLKKLRRLNLSYNNITGNIPASIENMTKLTELRLNDNMLSGGVPPGVGQMTSLVSIYMSNNNINGSLPGDIGLLTKIEVLDMGSNELKGKIPGQIGRLQSLRELALQKNRIQGTLPSQIGSARRLEILQLTDNNISGELPSEIGKLEKLETLGLGKNQISGTLPTELGNLSSLYNLALNDNSVNGSLPSEIRNAKNLKRLYMSRNSLAGRIPRAIGALVNLDELWLDRNQFLSGNIPSEIGLLSSLTILHLGNNSLTGGIPSEIGTAVHLEYLLLNDNNLTMPIPTEIGKLVKLRDFLVGSNALSGPIPTELEKLSELDHFDATNNQLTGNINNLCDLDIGHTLQADCAKVTCSCCKNCESKKSPTNEGQNRTASSLISSAHLRSYYNIPTVSLLSSWTDAAQ